jgi:Lrp/AsnC family transcriptional regulator for asnA, asnC and gidA
MDEIDIRLSLLLMRNSRIPYRDLADDLGISIQAVHRRIQLMREMGVIREFVTLPSPKGLACVNVFVFGRSLSRSMDETVRDIGSDDHIDGIYVASGNMMFISAVLRDISELDDLTELVRKVGQIPEPRIGITSQPQRSSAERGAPPLSNTDYAIIGSLHHDSRKSVTDVAKEIGISARSVNRHLGQMAKFGLVEFKIQWFPCDCRDIFAMMHLDLRPSLDKNAVLSDLKKKHGSRIVLPLAFSNIPNYALLLIWSTTPKELEEVQRSIEKEGSVGTVVTDILYVGHPFSNWRDRLLDGK